MKRIDAGVTNGGKEGLRQTGGEGVRDGAGDRESDMERGSERDRRETEMGSEGDGTAVIIIAEFAFLTQTAMGRGARSMYPISHKQTHNTHMQTQT